MDLHVLFTGLTLGISLILAIGAQNAFVLKQGLKREHVFAVCLICALSDAILISAGIIGFGAIVLKFPLIEQIARYAGAAFLFIYAIFSFKAAFTERHSLHAASTNAGSLSKAVLTCLAFTWLNPHVYLDTIVLLGSISTQYEGAQVSFGLGAVFGSFIFFFSLGYGARFLLPIFKQARAWQILEVMIGFVMLFIAISLLI